MKFAVCLLSIVSCAVALPAEIPFEAPEEVRHVFPILTHRLVFFLMSVIYLLIVQLALSKIVPKNVYREPINPVRIEDLPGPRVIGGEEVAPHTAPYQAALLVNGGSLCGGSLISVDRVLTAAHCTDG